MTAWLWVAAVWAVGFICVVAVCRAASEADDAMASFDVDLDDDRWGAS